MFSNINMSAHFLNQKKIKPNDIFKETKEKREIKIRKRDLKLLA